MTEPTTPRTVCDAAGAISRRIQSDAEHKLLNRLIDDPRMKAVWATLSGKRSSDPQQVAELEVEIFETVFVLAASPMVVTKTAMQEHGRELGTLAEELDALAKRIDRFFGTSTERSDSNEYSERLRSFAATFRNFLSMELEADELDLVFTRARGDLPLRAFVIRMARLFMHHFKTPLYETLAILASVALDQEVDKDQVRAIWRASDDFED